MNIKNDELRKQNAAMRKKVADLRKEAARVKELVDPQIASENANESNQEREEK